jgi:hypothetical protein
MTNKPTYEQAMAIFKEFNKSEPFFVSHATKHVHSLYHAFSPLMHQRQDHPCPVWSASSFPQALPQYIIAIYLNVASII